MPERYLSPSLRGQDAMALLVAPLVGVEAEIYNDLWNAVIDRKLKPGTKLEELAIGEIYGISRTVVRKVLVIMEQEGIVSLPVNRGAYVAEPSFRNAIEMLEVVQASMIFIIDKLASAPEHIDEEQRTRLSRHLEALATAETSADFHTVRRLHSEYFLLLALINGNRLIAGSIDRTINRFTIALALFQDTPLPGSRAQFASLLTGLILDGRRQEVHEQFVAFCETLRQSLSENADDAIDLKAILGKGRPTRQGQ